MIKEGIKIVSEIMSENHDSYHAPSYLVDYKNRYTFRL